MVTNWGGRIMTRTGWGLLAGVALTLLPGGLLAAPAPPRKTAPAYWALPWGIVDGAGRSGYVANSSGGIDALDLDTGKLLWSSPAGGRPLALVGRRLVVQSAVKDKPNGVRVLVLDTTRKGKVLLESEEVVLGGIPSRGGFGRSGRGDVERRVRVGPPLQALVDGSDLWLTWRGRLPPSSDRGRGGGRGGRGDRTAERPSPPPLAAARVSLRTGKVANVPGDKVPAPRGPALPEEVLKAVGRTPRGPFGRRTRVAVGGKYVVRVDVRGEDVGQKAVLRRWDVTTGKALEPVTLMTGAALAAVVAVDGRTVLVQQSTDEPLVGREDAWHVFSAETGKPLGKVGSPPNTYTVAALGDRAFFLVWDIPPDLDRSPSDMARRLRVVEMKTGKVLWDRPVPGGPGFRFMMR
jgi:hypothetical protein